MHRRAWALAILAAGCALDRSAIGASVPELDGGALDAGEIAEGDLDGGPPAMPDARPPDPIDAYVPPERIDAGTDAPPPEEPDAWMPPARTCDEYGDVRAYLPCPARIGDCAFYVDPSPDTSCRQICQLHDATCVGVVEDLANDCAGTVPLDCNSEYNDMICTCTFVPR